MGTPAYASPEQLGEQSATASTDLYSFGCVLYECLVGHPPFEAEMPVGVIAQHLQAPPRSLRPERPEIPPELEAAVLRALEKEPGRRFTSAEEMTLALRSPAVSSPGPGSPLSTVVHRARAPANGSGRPQRTEPAAEEAPATDDGKVKVVVVDDHPFFRDGVTRGLADSGQVAVVAEAENGREGLEVIRRERPAVALVDYQMPEMDGLDLVHAIEDERLPTRVLLLSAMADSAVVFRALEEGAAGYLSKDARRKEIVEAVLKAAEGQTVLPPELAGGLAGEIRQRARSQAVTLSDQELGVLRQFTRGHSIPTAAQEMGIEVATVETVAHALFVKLGVSDRAAAVAEGMRRGLLD